MVVLTDQTGQINKLNPQTDTDMETSKTTLSTLRGQAKRTYNRVIAAIAEDNAASMCHTFSSLTQQAKTIVLQCGKFSNLYLRGELKGMTAEEAAKDLTARCVACVSCKVRNIDIVITTVFLAEYISRQREEIEGPKSTTPETDTDMNANDTTSGLTLQETTYIGYYMRIYLHNTREIYDRFTVPAINRVVKAVKAGEYVGNNTERLAKDIQEVTTAIQTADFLVRKLDGMQPTEEDIKDVTANYVAYIIDAAKYELQNN